LSRRLGDDPLARAKAAAANADGASTGRQTTRGAYNEVFFRRRGDEADPLEAAVIDTIDGPEITEISEIPEIREVETTPIVEQGSTSATRFVEAPTISEEVTFQPSFVFAAADKTDSVSVGATAAEPVAPQANTDESQPSPDKESGFFKRLFGKFGK
jgi:hypothetical protein